MNTTMYYFAAESKLSTKFVREWFSKMAEADQTVKYAYKYINCIWLIKTNIHPDIIRLARIFTDIVSCDDDFFTFDSEGNTNGL